MSSPVLDQVTSVKVKLGLLVAVRRASDVVVQPLARDSIHVDDRSILVPEAPLRNPGVSVGK